MAISVGFDSQSSFNREFRKRFGCSPGIYRSRLGWDLSWLTPWAEQDETGTHCNTARENVSVNGVMFVPGRAYSRDT
ncbi:TPA: helix-turn-helix transcriptional regulator [Escherichia coli]|nr:helix-turn-helix transcriptional regulator [Escherichia coli]